VAGVEEVFEVAEAVTEVAEEVTEEAAEVSVVVVEAVVVVAAAVEDPLHEAAVDVAAEVQHSVEHCYSCLLVP